MEVAIINTVLGRRAGVLELVFRLLPLRDMKNVVLVCHLWRDVGEASGLWAWIVLRVTRENMSLMPERLGCRRMRAVRKIRVMSSSLSSWVDSTCGSESWRRASRSWRKRAKEEHRGNSCRIGTVRDAGTTFF